MANKKEMMQRIFFQFSFWLVIIGLSPGAAEDLIPAAMGIRTDPKGNSWSIEENGSIGRIGSTMMNSGLSLSVNGQKFVGQQPLMTADGKEFVIAGRSSSMLPGLSVDRRIRVMDGDGGLRYLEILRNQSANPLVLNVYLSNNFSGNFKSFVSDRGNAEISILGSGESGLVVTAGSSQSSKAFLFSLCSPASKEKPTISAENRYSMAFQYRVTLQPGETKVIAHAVGQVVIPQSYERRNLLRLFRPYSIDRLARGLREDWKNSLANGRITLPGDEFDLLGNTNIAALGVERGPRDILAMGEQTRLIGTVKGSEIVLTTDYGEAHIPLARVAAIVGENQGLRESVRLFLKDGQILSGNASSESFQFTLASGGSMNLNFASLDRLVRGVRKKGAETGAEPEKTAILETHRGDRFRVPLSSTHTLRAVSAWGEISFRLDELIAIGPNEEESVGHQIELKDGTRCLAFLHGEAIAIDSPILGEVAIKLRDIRRIVTAATEERSRYRIVPGTRTVLRVAGEQQLVGEIVDEQLQLVSNGQAIVMSPREFRSLTRSNQGRRRQVFAPTSFTMETWDGGKISGLILDDFLTLRIGGSTWRIPVADIDELETPVPSLGEDSRARLLELVAALASEDWQTRESATTELSAFGYLARPLLESELLQSKDPEVHRRLERVLAEMQD